MRPSGNLSRAFTLVELVIVLAVIAIAAALLFPLLAQARERIHGSACTSNLRQYSSAFRMYVQDYDGAFPLARLETPYRPPELSYSTWDLLLQAYLRNADVARCPSDPFPAFFEFKDGSRAWRSYAVPRNLIWNPDRDNPRRNRYPMKLAELSRPAGTLMLFERTQGVDVNQSPYPRLRQPRSWQNGAVFENYQECAWERHRNHLNALFVDGHAGMLTGKRPGQWRWPPDPADRTYRWPHLEGYVFRPGARDRFDHDTNGDQFWQDCPLPGEAPSSAACR